MNSLYTHGIYRFTIKNIYTYSMGICYESTASGMICPPTSNPKHLRLQSTKTNGWNPKKNEGLVQKMFLFKIGCCLSSMLICQGDFGSFSFRVDIFRFLSPEKFSRVSCRGTGNSVLFEIAVSIETICLVLRNGNFERSNGYFIYTP